MRYDRWGNPTDNHKPPRANAPTSRPIPKLARRALKLGGMAGVLIWISQALDDPNFIRNEIRENSLCTTGNCDGIDPEVYEKKMDETNAGAH